MNVRTDIPLSLMNQSHGNTSGADNAKKDRDERERPRSRVEESSRQKRDPSATRRDRDRDNRDRERRSDRDRDESKKDRQDSRREKDESARRDRETDKEGDPEDPRRWRDDGKRDERIAARRERVEKDREHMHEKTPHEGHDSAHERHHDRRWVTGEEREARPKRTSGRERRPGVSDDHKERDDRKDRDREREKEPAWMDTYIPSESSTGILGGKVANGELDSIQAWKKGMKAKEQGSGATKDIPTTTDGSDVPERQLDEIQLFKMMMKREEEKKRVEGKDSEDVRSLSAQYEKEGPSSLVPKTREQQKALVLSNGEAFVVSHCASAQ